MPTTTSTTAPPTVVTLQPQPNGRIPSSAQDGADLWGFALAIVVMVVAIAAVRLIFRHRR